MPDPTPDTFPDGVEQRDIDAAILEEAQHLLAYATTAGDTAEDVALRVICRLLAEKEAFLAPAPNSIEKSIATFMISGGVPISEFDPSFVTKMVQAMMVSFHKYGKLDQAYPLKFDASSDVRARMAKYRGTGNKHYLVDAANFAMIEAMHPDPGKKTSWGSNSAADSPGRTTASGHRLVQEDNEGNRIMGETILRREDNVEINSGEEVPVSLAPAPGAVEGDTAGRYRKKPVVIDAVQILTEEQAAATRGICTGGASCKSRGAPDNAWPHVHSLEGDHTWSPGDWLITGVKGEQYFCKPDIFEMTYDATLPRQTLDVDALRERVARALYAEWQGEEPTLDSSIPWDHLPPSTRSAWENSARAALSAMPATPDDQGDALREAATRLLEQHELYGSVGDSLWADLRAALPKPPVQEGEG